MSREEYKRYIDHSIPFKYNCNGHLIHDCLKNPNRDKYEIMRFIQPKTWMLREYWNSHVDIPIIVCPWCGRNLDMNISPEGKRYGVIKEKEDD